MNHHIKWEFHNAIEVFPHYREQWDELNKKTSDSHILLSSNFVSPLLSHFGKPNTLLGISKDPLFPGMVLVEPVRKGFWQTFQPAQAPVGLIILENDQNLEQQIEGILAGLPGIALGFSVTQLDPDFSVFNNATGESRLRKIDYIQTARIVVRDTFDEYWKKRGKDLRSNLERRERRLKSNGIQVELWITELESQVDVSIEQYGLLESKGWKGKTGTAVKMDNIQGSFYREVLHGFFGDGEGCIFQLLFNGKPVASQLCLKRGDVLVLLKTAYDEQFKDYSPGFMLRKKILESVFSSGEVSKIEFFGRVREGWTTKWTDDIRTMYHVNYFRYDWVEQGRDLFKRLLSLPSHYTQEGGGSLETNSGKASSFEIDTRERTKPQNSDKRAWSFVPAIEGFERYKGRWQEINKHFGNHLLLDPKFISPLIQYFATPNTLLGFSNHSEDPSMVLVDGVGGGFWQTFQPSQAPMGLILWQKSADLERQLQEFISSLPGFALGFSVMQQDPDYTAFPYVEFENNKDLVDYIRTPRITLIGTFEEYWKTRSRDLRGNLARRRRRLSEKGAHLEMSIVRDPERVAEAVKVYGQLEESGWKVNMGTAVTALNEQGLFYRDMLQGFFRHGEGIIYQLFLDGVPIASDLCLKRDGMLILLKTAYDESYKNVSPSFLMREEILQGLFAEKQIKVLEFYGRAREWHEKWTSEIRMMYHINFYRHSLVRQGKNLLKRGALGLREGKG